ncbi:MAG: D-alanine--D-alanine ligase [Rhodospirillales bacterium]|nr:D-alanine--D-alanine ligase [Rhodospirillales bacterium]
MKLDTALRFARDTARGESPLSYFEFWPDWLFYTPVVAHWIGLGLWYGDMSLPTAANPRIPTGGLCGESKLDILDQVSPEARDLIAPSTGIVTHAWSGDADVAAAEAAMAKAGLAWPVVVKPDIGCNGTGVRLLQNAGDLRRYVNAFPRNTRLVLQKFVPAPLEAGLFYVRLPGEAQGRVTSITLKHAPSVIGDGRSTLHQLILADARAGKVAHLYLERLRHRLHEVPPQGETVRLVFVGNHCKGSIFEDGRHLATPSLTEAVERLARAIPDFHFGRIDVRFDSVPSLVLGDFTVIEINGTGSDATHIWDRRTTLREAWRAQFFHYGAAFRIGAANRARGARPSGLRAMWRHWRLQKRLMAAYPLND